ncbi:MAG: twin-arginine translocase TatA/TatE family subunit [Alphaproteobacteria bacterium]|nr:twin-arginine translocase TatA/TatE family subunit [Alphaproteobacteria bacterium]
MLNIGWPEAFVVGAVALVAVGPKDLPKVFYALGRLVGKARVFMNDFHRALDQVSREAEARESSEKKKAPPSSRDRV